MPALRCKPGDFAVCVMGTASGTFVTVLERGPDHPLLGWPAWACRVAAPCKATKVNMVTGRRMSHFTTQPGAIVLFCDRELQPIKPPPVPETLPPLEIEHA